MTEKNKGKALLVDFGNHYKQIEHAAYLWRDYDITFLSDPNSLQCVESQFIKEKKGFSGRFKDWRILTYIFLSLLFLNKKLICLTAPEYNLGKQGYITKLIWLFTFFLCKSNIFLYVKNIDAYRKSYILNWTLRLSKLILFESKTQKKKFYNEFIFLKSKTTIVAYVYYPDFIREHNNEHYILKEINKKKSEGLKMIGLIGQFDFNRRDYSILFKLLDQGTFCDKVFFVQIGRVKNSTLELKKKKEYSDKIMFIKSDYKSEELDMLLQAADFLVSMNKIDIGYTQGKGTAAFSEAISVKKRLLVPKFLENNTEFSFFSYFYDDEKSFIKAINIANAEYTNVNDLELFSSESVMIEINNYLKSED